MDLFYLNLKGCRSVPVTAITIGWCNSFTSNHYPAQRENAWEHRNNQGPTANYWHVFQITQIFLTTLYLFPTSKCGTHVFSCFEYGAWIYQVRLLAVQHSCTKIQEVDVQKKLRPTLWVDSDFSKRYQRAGKKTLCTWQTLLYIFLAKIGQLTVK